MPHADDAPLARRFRVRARLITVAAILGAAGVAVGGAVAMVLTGGPRDGGLVAYALAVGTMLVVIVGLGLTTTPLARALQTLRERHPDQAVFLARRLPSVVSDMPQYLASHGLQLDISDGWYPATVDAAGINVWQPRAQPQKLFTIPWSEIGEILPVRSPTVLGDARWSVTVDVKPYIVPLTVDVGYAWGLVTMAMDAADTADVVTATVAQRP